MAVRGVGVDAVDVDRFTRILERRPRLLDRLFQPLEREQCAERPDRLAARFAAKEAAWKALGVGLGATGWRDVSVELDDAGAPHLRVTGRAAHLAAERGVTAWHVSLSHTDTTAVAVVIAEEQHRAG